MVIYKDSLSGDTVGFVLSNALNVSLQPGSMVKLMAILKLLREYTMESVLLIPF